MSGKGRDGPSGAWHPDGFTKPCGASPLETASCNPGRRKKPAPSNNNTGQFPFNDTVRSTHSNHDNPLYLKKAPILTGLLLAGLLTGLLPALSVPEATAQQRRAFGYQNQQEHDAKPYHFGFALGVNRMNFSLRPRESVTDAQGFRYVLPEPEVFGFHLGIVSNLKLSDYFDLRFIPTLSFGDRYVEFYEESFINGEYQNAQALESTMLEFPLMLKYKSERMTNTRVYVLGGLKYTHDLASLDELESGIILDLGRNDVHYELGVGFDHYFYFFKFSTEIKMSFGLFDLKRQYGDRVTYIEPISRLSSRTIMVSFLFE